MIAIWSFVACIHKLPSASPAGVPPTPEPAPPPAPIVDSFSTEPEGSCGVFEEFGETASYPALGDRFRITLPNDTFAEATDTDTESRFVVDRGASRLVVLVHETYGRATDQLAEVIARNEHSPASIVRTQVAGLSAAVVEPEVAWGPPGGVLVGSAWYNSPDGTVVNVGVLTTPDAAPTPEACRRVARRVLTSVTPSTERLNLEGGEQEFQGYRVQVPPGYATSTERGDESMVVRIFPVVPLEDEIPQLGFYLGPHPTFQPVGTPRAGEVLGEPVTWYANEQGDWLNTDALLSTGDQLLHVFVSAPDQTSLEALVDIAETLRRAH